MENAKIKRADSHIVSSATLATFTLTLVILLGLTVVTQAAHAQTYNVIHNFTGGARDGSHPYSGLTMIEGNLYGTTADGGASYGTVYQLAHQTSGWVFSLIYSFQGGNDGAYPIARVVPRAERHLLRDHYRGRRRLWSGFQFESSAHIPQGAARHTQLFGQLE